MGTEVLFHISYFPCVPFKKCCSLTLLHSGRLAVLKPTNDATAFASSCGRLETDNALCMGAGSEEMIELRLGATVLTPLTVSSFFSFFFFALAQGRRQSRSER